jgi:hypothetical protein
MLLNTVFMLVLLPALLRMGEAAAASIPAAMPGAIKEGA